jgi:large repetitive protein
MKRNLSLFFLMVGLLVAGVRANAASLGTFDANCAGTSSTASVTGNVGDTITVYSSGGYCLFNSITPGAVTGDPALNGGGIGGAKVYTIAYGGTYAATFLYLTPQIGLTLTVNAAAIAPVATTGAASSTTATGTTLNGTVIDNGASTTVTFNYGPTLSYGSSVTATQSPISPSSGSVSVSAALTGLVCNTTYHYQVSATNSVNTTNGSDATFTTSPCTYTIGGSVSGLASGQSVVLQNNGGDDNTVNANGAFTFATPVNSGSAYAVTVLTQPTGQTCTVSSGSGTANANVTTVSVSCVTNTYTIGGSVSGLASGQSVVLQNNGGDDNTVNANGAFTFATPVNSGSAYAVTVLTQPTGQTCTVNNGSGSNVTANVSSVSVTCTTNTYTIGGSVSGLANGQSVVLQNNGGDNKTVNVNGGFTFATSINSGSAFAVTVLTQPTGQTCMVGNGTGTANANVSNVAVTCTDNPPPTPSITSITPVTQGLRVAFDTGTVASASSSVTIASVNYTAGCTSTNGGVSGTTAGPASPITVTNLTAGKSYTCTVSASDTGGTSTSSASAAAIPLAPPTPQPIPTLSEWAQIMMMLAMIATAGFYGWRMKQR